MAADEASPLTPPLALTMGDPAGIGLDITLMAWSWRAARKLPPFVLFGDPDALAERAQTLGIAVQVETVAKPSAADCNLDRAVPVIPVSLPKRAMPGRADPANGSAVIDAIEMATSAVMRGEASAVVTCPIAKSVLYATGFAFPGHTEFLAALAERHTGRAARPVMMLAADELRVVPLTIHIPLADVPSAITRTLIVETTEIVASALKRDFGISRPRIAVAGMNPHAGESGTIGSEEIDFIVPALTALERAGIAVTGPLPADTMFHPAARARYDAAIAMYHDQALIPIKTLAFDRGVNVTLGLPFVRTSPDHGTAFDIAGSGAASPESLIQAMLMAEQMACRRRAVASHTS